MHNVAHGAKQEIFEGGAKYFSYVNLPFITCVWFKVHSNVDTFDWIALRQKFLPRIGTTSSCAHSSEIRDSCWKKGPVEMLQNFHKKGFQYFSYSKNMTNWFHFIFFFPGFWILAWRFRLKRWVDQFWRFLSRCGFLFGAKFKISSSTNRHEWRGNNCNTSYR